ncbi:hypothetical protein KUTeg_022553 [Tegillarca granosa]|uniref:EF-hand domain-containing protein n=1 Tax=Tegillarca granosa TaxID=220873 RepID=A0ABQ9E9D0_TEGGR|nr:hypothetical protein KUTeg_022553 [Tegillarca granosa]
MIYTSVFDFRIHCHIGRPPLPDSVEARHLFQVAETNRTPDGFLTKMEIVDIFKKFDQNGDNLVDENEFLERWKFENLGTYREGLTIFKNLDTDQDSYITQVPDLSRAFIYFDRDGTMFLFNIVNNISR